MRAAARQVGIVIGLIVGMLSPARAQERLRVHADVLFYGDNTEFRNPFREGETIFGAAARAALAVDLNDRVSVGGGAYGRFRFGDDGFERVRPVISLEVRGERSVLVIGTFPPPRAGSSIADAGTLHGLLPPLQRETLVFERGYENGLLWTLETPEVRSSAWLNWQRLNTAEHRERFDAGSAAEVRLSRSLFLPLQAHIVHEGGQLHSSGPVSDSYAGAAGLALQRGIEGSITARLEAHVLASRHVPDRELPAASRTGRAVYLRTAAEIAAWRAHVLFWRGRDFVKSEGDPNYLSIRRDGRYYGGIRDYTEAGLTRRWVPASTVSLEASGRLHRTERHYEYSFRIVAAARLNWLHQ